MFLDLERDLYEKRRFRFPLVEKRSLSFAHEIVIRTLLDKEIWKSKSKNSFLISLTRDSRFEGNSIVIDIREIFVYVFDVMEELVG